MDTDGPDEGAQKLTEKVLEACRECIPIKALKEHKSSHPWLTDEVMNLVAEKQMAEGTEEEDAAREACSKGILEEFGKYVRQTKEDLKALPRGSKLWWKKSRELLQQQGAVSSSPALKDKDNQWVLNAQGKADLFADTFAKKFVLADASANHFSELPLTDVEQDLPADLEEKDAEEVLKKLKEDSATGPDQLPTKVFKECARELRKPLLRLAKRMLETGCWPALWLQRWVVPLYKKKAVFQPTNYRGVHLTAQLSKAMERLLGRLFFPFLAQPSNSGPQQFAYTKDRGARDALAYLVLTWLAGFNNKKKFGMLCSDVSGAFDRVKSSRLVQKLRAKGLNSKVVQVVVSWLRARTAKVVVGGKLSKAMTLKDMVYQGTVFGPTLWNAFFEDVRQAVNKKGFLEAVYADDLNSFKEFDSKVPNEVVKTETEACQEELHLWGEANQVAFDPSKESTHVLSRKEATSKF